MRIVAVGILLSTAKPYVDSRPILPPAQFRIVGRDSKLEEFD